LQTFYILSSILFLFGLVFYDVRKGIGHSQKGQQKPGADKAEVFALVLSDTTKPPRANCE
jgi:hypothetical protein